MRRFLVPIAMLVSFVSASSSVQADSSKLQYTLLDDNASQLREDFNGAKGSVRLLFVVDPVCPGCLRGLDDLNEALLATTSDPRLQTFVVHLPVLVPAAKANDVAPAAELLHNAHVRHYWNPSGTFGRQLSEACNLKHGDESVYAWDVWLIYGPEASWDGVAPPRPRRLMHQLRALEGSAEFPRLNKGVFAREVHALLAQLPAPSGGSAHP